MLYLLEPASGSTPLLPSPRRLNGEGRENHSVNVNNGNLSDSTLDGLAGNQPSDWNKLGPYYHRFTFNPTFSG